MAHRMQTIREFSGKTLAFFEEMCYNEAIKIRIREEYPMRKKQRELQSCAAAMSVVFTAAVMQPLPLPSVSAAAEKPLFAAEAETLTLSSGAEATTKVYNDEYPGYSGTGFVWAPSGSITFEITIEEGAMYELSTRCWMYLGELGETRMQNIAVDGELLNSFYIPNNGDWMDYSFGFFYLAPGEHTIEIGSSGSWGYVLYDTVTFDYADMPDLNIEPTPCDPKATPETKALMQYMTEQYGNHILSGQQEIYGSGNNGDTELEFEYIFDATGQYPAIRGFDMMNYNPLYGWEDGSTGRIIQWVTQRGGIATACWHINVPKDFDNYEVGDFVDWEQCSYQNYQKSGSSFNTANVLVEGTKERAYFDEAVRMLAEQLLILQDANVPIILRPLHEAQGNYGRYGDGTSWFWWGDRGPEVYRELWKLLYTKLTEEYGVHNCIWEINLYELDSSYEWYPGDEYVDMVAYDKYEGSPYQWGTDPATSVFLTLVNDTNDTKMVAIAECDKIPAIEGMVNEGAWWSYFCPWYGEYITSEGTNSKAHLKEVYNSEYVVSLDELPTDLYGYERGNGGNWNVEGAIECEDGTLTAHDGTVVIDYKYCSGTGYVFLKGENDAIEQTVTVKEAGKYAISYGYQQNYEEAGKTQLLYVNGAEAGEAFFPYSIMFGESEPILVDLKAGENTIRLVSAEGWTYFDYLLVRPEGDVTTATQPDDSKKLLGDVDTDGEVGLADAILLARYNAEDAAVKVTKTGLVNADLNGDGTLNSEDVVQILRILAKLA